MKIFTFKDLKTIMHAGLACFLIVEIIFIICLFGKQSLNPYTWSVGFRGFSAIVGLLSAGIFAWAILPESED